MEEFKKPSLPIVPPKCERLPADLEIQTEITKELTKGPVTITNKTATPANSSCPYKVPSWSNPPNDNKTYSFEVLKSGQIIDKVKNLESRAFWTFGRLPENNIEMAHPTISRFHAILQYKPPKISTETADEGEETEKEDDKGPPVGWYIYDLDSTHGTFLNKQRIPPKVYIRIRVGYILRLGASTRSYILQGPEEDAEAESELTITELKAKRQREMEEAALEKKRLADEAEEKARNEGCGWGMGDDADEETDLTHNPYASTNNEELFLDDPKKTLRGYFEREGLQLEYKCDEMSAGSFVCRVELPLDSDNGRPIIAEVVHKGKKKDCVVQCALEACRILDRHGVLRQANQEPLKRKQKANESDSDDDEFWDRTGDVARKKQRKAKVSTTVTLTYDDLLKQEAELKQQLMQVQSSIETYQEQQKISKTQKDQDEHGDDLDSYMENLQTPMDKTEIKKLRLEELRLKTELQRNQRLLKIAKPIDLPFGKNPLESNQEQQFKNDTRKRQLPIIGKRNQFSKFKIIKPASTSTKPQSSSSLASDEEEVEEDDNELKGAINSTENKRQIQDVFENIQDIKKEDRSLKTLEDVHQKNKDEDVLILGDINQDNRKKDFPKISREQTDESKGEDNDEILKSIETNDLDRLSKINPDNTSEPCAVSNVSSDGGKKRRHRIRQRGKRQEVDIDDDVEYESTEKYAKWVPPDNQSGDGITELNKKYGY